MMGKTMTAAAMLALLVFAMPASAVGNGGEHDDPACSPSARSALRSCREEAKGAYWLAVARCENVASERAQDECEAEAKKGLSSDNEDCRDRYDGRREACEALGEAPYDPPVNADRFVAGINNPFLPLVPGTTWVYEAKTKAGTERTVVTATHGTREILGVTCTVVRDTVYLDGEMVEDTRDWFAQDVDGNVWYFGELSYELEASVIVGIEGSWEAGVDGGKPGIAMEAYPAADDVYRQEFLLGEAEDMAEVVSLDASAHVPYGDFVGCVKTKEYAPIEPGDNENKYYAPGVGMILEENPDTGVRTALVERSVE